MGKLYTSPEVTVIQTESPTIISGSGSNKLERNEMREDASVARTKFYDDKNLWDDIDEE